MNSNIVTEINISDYQSIKNICVHRIEEIENVKRKVKVVKESLDQELERHVEYRDLERQIKQLQAKRKALKESLLMTPIGSELSITLKELKTEAREIKETLGILLEDYKHKTGIPEIEISDGRIYKIKAAYQLSLL